MEALTNNPALVTDHLVLRTTTEEAAIAHQRQVLNQGHYLKAIWIHTRPLTKTNAAPPV